MKNEKNSWKTFKRVLRKLMSASTVIQQVSHGKEFSEHGKRKND